MLTKLLFSAVVLGGSAVAQADTTKPTRTIAAALDGAEAESAFFSMSDYREKSYELHGLFITHRSNVSMSCREAIRNNTAKFSCFVFSNEP